jgi:tetratricopeptide (TPR) repeat protein
VRGDLDNIVMKAMRKEPARRYSSVDQLAEDVRSYLESRPVLARPDTLWYRWTKFAHRRRYVLLVTAGVAASLLFGIVAALSQAREAKRARQAAEMHRDMAIGQQKRAEERLAQIVSLSNLSLSEVYARMERLPGAMPARKELVSGTVSFLEQVSKEAGDNVPLRMALAKAYLRLGDLQGDPDAPNLGDTAGALRSFQAGSALLNPVSPLRGGQQSSDAVERLEIWADLQGKIGKVFVELNRPGASDVFRRAIAVVEASTAGLKSAHRIKATLYLSLSRATLDLPLALQYASKALQEAEAAATAPGSIGDSSLQLLLSNTHTQTGWVNILMENPDATVPHYEASIQIREKLARDHPNDILYRRYLKLAYEHFASLQGNPDRANMGHPEIAWLYYKKAQPLEEADLSDPQNHSAKFDYALFQLKLGAMEAPAEALTAMLAAMRQAAQTFARLAASEPGVVRYEHSLAEAHERIGRFLAQMGRYAEAIVEYQKSLALYKRFFGDGIADEIVYQRIGAAERGITKSLALSGDRTSALGRARSVALRMESVESSVRPLVAAEAYLTLAEVHQKFGECGEAAAAARHSIHVVEPSRKHSRGNRIRLAAEGVIAECSAGLDGVSIPF